ncbi:MAG: hypothetical protein H6752_17875 [Candidatus Omnitrophica bacterium]|nr:hypothetical protein [Candidatus Omnitrophota bacterium]
MNQSRNVDACSMVGWWQPVLLSALAGGMAWGIRGQYGHETGAMIAGLLVSLVLVFLLCPKNISSLTMVRAAAWGTVAMGVGGSMTYGQTLGLTQNGPVIGNWEALRWGLLGCAIKGGIWIGFAGAFLGMGLSKIKYRPKEMWVLMLALIGAYYIGLSLMNRPYNPATGEVPHFYFSEYSYFYPDKEVSPRHESWGGLLFALLTLIAYIRWQRKDRLAFNMALWGILGGALGFPGGQSLQAYHVWNPEVFDRGIWVELDQYMNWWNNMETTFGTIMGAVLGLGLWLNRHMIQPEVCDEEDNLPSWGEGSLLAIHLILLVLVEFSSVDAVDRAYDLGLIMIAIPVVAIVGGRFWPYLQILPLILIPIAGKTLKNLSYDTQDVGVVLGWLLFVVIPLAITLLVAVLEIRKPETQRNGHAFIRWTLLLNAWIYFLLNYAFFRLPWPWAEWTGRTPNGIVFTICLFGITLAALFSRRREPQILNP